MIARAMTNLPAQLTSLVGREPDLERVAGLIAADSARLVTLTGVGGCGKTRLALALGETVARSFPGGVWFAPLDSVADDRLLVQAVAAALDLSEAGGTHLLPAVARILDGQPALLILDNCEHLIDASARLALDLLTACPSLSLLATSREPLQIAGERQYRLEPLRVPARPVLATADDPMSFPAVRLFVERAQAHAADFRLTPDNTADIVAICARLDGIPLAIELAAARVGSLSLAEMLAQLDDCFRLLRGVGRGRPTRQQTMRAALDWSYDLLGHDERALFRQLAVFAGGFDLEAVVAVAAVDDAAQLLTQLTDKSLVSIGHGPRAMRRRLLEPVRQYAARLLAGDEAAETRARHAAHFLSLAEAAAAESRGPRQIEWLDRLEQEESNLRAALRWWSDRRDSDSGLRFAVALFPFWSARSRLTEGRRWLESALDAAGSATSTLPGGRVAHACRAVGHLAFLQYDFDAAESFLRRALQAFRAGGDQPGVAMSLATLSLVPAFHGDHPRAAALSDEAVALARSVDDPPTLLFALMASGNAAQERSDAPVARRALEEAQRLARALGDIGQLATIATVLGAIELKDDNPAVAAGALRDALAIHHRMGDRWFVIYDLLLLATALARLGRPQRAARLLGAAGGLATALGETFSPIGGSAARALVQSLRHSLGDAQLDAARAEGSALSPDDAVAEALGALDAHPEAPDAALPGSPASSRLTRRELEVAQWIARGATDREIADALFISPGTVGVHVHRILRKLGLRSRWQVAGALRLHQLGSPEAE